MHRPFDVPHNGTAVNYVPRHCVPDASEFEPDLQGTPEQPLPTRRLVVVYKSNGNDETNAALQERVDALTGMTDRWIDTKGIPTTAGNAYLDALDDTLGDNTDVIIFGGDGTTSYVLERLQASQHTGIRAVLVGTGTKNDMAREHGGKHYNDPLFLLDHGQERPLYMLDLTFDKGGRHERRFKAGYVAGLGGEAITSRLVDAEGFRKYRACAAKLGKTIVGKILGLEWAVVQAGEKWSAVDGIMRNPAFGTRHIGAEYEQQKPKHNFAKNMDLMFGGQGRVAGNSIKLPAEADDPESFAVHRTPNRFHRIIGTLAVAITRTSGIQHGTYRTYLEDNANFQKDGEYLGMAPAGILEVRRSDRPLTVMNANPRAQRRGAKRTAAKRKHQSVTLAA